MCVEKNKKEDVRSGVRTHASFRRPELKSGALDRSAILTWCRNVVNGIFQQNFDKNNRQMTSIDEYFNKLSSILIVSMRNMQIFQFTSKIENMNEKVMLYLYWCRLFTVQHIQSNLVIYACLCFVCCLCICKHDVYNSLHIKTVNHKMPLFGI